MILIEDKNFLNNSQKSHIENTYISHNFPYFLIPRSVTNKKNKKNIDKPLFGHIVLRRPEERKENEYFNSPEGDFCLSILKTFCKKHKIKINEVLRISINLSFNNGNIKCETHEDHNYPHKQLIVYLNDSDVRSFTVIKDNKKEIKIKPEKYKGLFFESKPHYLFFPKKGIRIVMVITFR